MMKKHILLLLLLISTIYNIESQSLVQFHFDNIADTSVYNYNYKFFNWNNFNDDCKFGMIFDSTRQVPGSKGFLDFSGTPIADTSNRMRMFSISIDTFFIFKPGHADWNTFNANPYVTFMANTSDDDFINLDIGWANSADNYWRSENVLSFTTYGKWKTFQVNLNAIDWISSSPEQPNPDLLNPPYFIYLYFYTSPFRNDGEINLSVDNIGITSSPLPYINGGYFQSAVCDMDKQLSVATKISDDTSIHYLWTPAEGLSATNISNPVVQIKSDQKYFVTTTLPDSIITDSVYIKVFPLTVKIINDPVPCNRNAQLFAIANYNDTASLIYKWSPSTGLSATDIYNPFLNLLSPTEYKVEVETSNGCMASDSTLINFHIDGFTEEICCVTVDNQIMKNKIIWGKTIGKQFKKYEIYKESSKRDSFYLIGTVPYNDLNVFVDSNSNPSQQLSMYRIVAVDSCENKFGPSTTRSPINLMIFPGLPGKFNLMWSYFDIQYYDNTYYILKGNSPDNLQIIDEVSASYKQYVDTASGIAYYQVAVKNPYPCYLFPPNGDPELINYSVSNIERNIIDKIDHVEIDQYLSIFPNPFKNVINIEYLLHSPSYINLSLFNLLGKQLYQYSQKNVNPELFKHSIALDNLQDISQVNILRFEVNGAVVFKKVIKQ